MCLMFFQNRLKNKFVEVDARQSTFKIRVQRIVCPDYARYFRPHLTHCDHYPPMRTRPVPEYRLNTKAVRTRGLLQEGRRLIEQGCQPRLGADQYIDFQVYHVLHSLCHVCVARIEFTFEVV